jgi:hypothetical protein
MDILNILFIYTAVLAVLYVAYGVAISVERAIAQVTGHTYASILAEVSLAAKLAPNFVFSVIANITEGKATASPRYFG